MDGLMGGRNDGDGFKQGENGEPHLGSRKAFVIVVPRLPTSLFIFSF